MKQRKITSTSDKRKLAQDPGELGEELAKRAYGLSNQSALFADLSNDAGSLYEVKTAATRLDDGQKGRFRLFKGQHEKLVRRDREDTAWYIFVLVDTSQRPPVARMKRKDPASIGNIIGGKGGWYSTDWGKTGENYYLPYDEVF